MDIKNIFAMSFIQGITEVLPVSSSAHLKLFSRVVVPLSDGKIALLHFGSALAFFVYFFKDFLRVFRDFFAFFLGKKSWIMLSCFFSVLSYL